MVTAADMPEVSAKLSEIEEGAAVNYGFYSRNVMAREKALYKGHTVAAVAAVSGHIAEEALTLIEVDYEVLEPVFTAEEAMKDDAPILHERLVTMADAAFRGGGYADDDVERPSNVANHFEFKLGEPEQGFAEADVVVEREYHTRPVHQGYIEPHSATAYWGTDGLVTIWTSSQGHFALRDHTSSMLELPVSQVKIIPMEIGGGFGGKGQGGCYLEPVAAVLSRKTGHPVKLSMTRTDVFLGTGPTSAGHIKIKIGARNDGKMVAADARLVFEAGAFPGSPVASGTRTIFGPYDIQNAYLEAMDVVVNTQKVAAYRAPGSPIASFAAETVIDELCEKLGMDPIEMRLLNASKEGTRQVVGPVFQRIGNVEVLQAARDHDHNKTPVSPDGPDGKKRGRGVASGAWMNGTGPASAVASVNADGTVSLLEGSPDIGGSRAVAAMHVAEVLGIGAEDVKPSIGDTAAIGYSTGAGGSGVTYKTGTAVYEAAQDVKRQMIARAATIWDADQNDIEYSDRGLLSHKSDPELRMTFAELGGQAERHRRSHCWAGGGQPVQGGKRLRRPHGGRGSGPGDGQGGHTAIHHLPGRGNGHTSLLRGGPDAGRGRPGHRLGPQRRVLHERRRADAELQLPGLQDAHLTGPAHDRHGDNRGAQPWPSLWRQGSGRGFPGPAHGGGGQCDTRRNRGQNDPAPHEPRGHTGNHVGTRGLTVERFTVGATGWSPI